MFDFTGKAQSKVVVLTTMLNGTSSCIGCSSFGAAAPRQRLIGESSMNAAELTCFHCVLLDQIHESLKVAEGGSNSDTLVEWIRGQQTSSRVVKLSSNRDTPRYATVLKHEEAIYHNCHQIGICKVTWDNHRVRIQCVSGKCTKIHSYVTEDESKIGAHARKTIEFLRQNEPSVLTAPSFRTSSRSTSTVGVTFDPETACWCPDENCSSNNIPESPSAEAISWFHKRSTMDDIERESDGTPKRDERNCLIGPPCIRNTCGKCGKVREAEVWVGEIRIIVVHTINGPVARKKFNWACACGNLVVWDAGSEHIHTIRNGAEGGM